MEEATRSSPHFDQAVRFENQKSNDQCAKHHLTHGREQGHGIGGPNGQQGGPQGGGQVGPQGGNPDLVAAAKKLGISEQTLRDALGPPPPNLVSAAQKLGITESALRAALGI